MTKKLKLMDIVIFSFSAIVAITAAGLTIFVELSHDEAVIPILYPLMPGLIAGLLITGGHGGTATEEKIAAIVAALVNAVFYSALILISRRIWNLLLRRRDAYARNAQEYESKP